VTITAPHDNSIDDAQALFREARRRRRRRRRWLVAVCLAVIAATLLAVLLVDSHGNKRSGSYPSEVQALKGGAFPDRTGTVLVFHDGYDGVLSLDLDHRVAARRVVEGQRAGDQPWDIVKVGASLVVGWGQVWAAPIAGGTSRLLGQGATTTFFPAAEPGQVWLDYPSGPTDNGPPTLREVDVKTGATTRQGQGPDPSQGTPVVGVPGGVAFATPRGVALWDARTGTFTRRLGTQQSYIADAAAGHLAWCEGYGGMCSTMHITALAGGDRVISIPHGRVFNLSARFSPNGKHLAVVTTHSGIESSDQQGSLLVIDSRTGSTVAADRTISAWSSLSWNDASSRLFFASGTHRGMVLGQYFPATGHTETAAVPIMGADPFVILSRPRATSFLTSTLGPPTACPAPEVGRPLGPHTRLPGGSPRVRTGICGFTF